MKIVNHILYKFFDNLMMLISPALEAVLDQVELASAKRSSARLENPQAWIEERNPSWSGESKFNESQVGKILA